MPCRAARPRFGREIRRHAFAQLRLLPCHPITVAFIVCSYTKPHSVRDLLAALRIPIAICGVACSQFLSVNPELLTGQFFAVEIVQYLDARPVRRPDNRI